MTLIIFFIKSAYIRPQINTKSKLCELISHLLRIKRGSINAMWFIFNGISRNLDASDGECYKALINQLNQQ